jgi:hypothetical protein
LYHSQVHQPDFATPGCWHYDFAPSSWS